MVFLVLPVFVAASITDGTIDSTYKYAWAENAGWINFGCESCNIRITDSGLTGYAWSQNYGWINLNPVLGGVKNNNGGILSGKAWGEYVGWIDFSGVSIDSNGQFQGATQSNDIIGNINFNFSSDCLGCKIITDWRSAGSRGGGGLNPGAYALPLSPVGGFRFTINQGASTTLNRIINLNFTAGPDVKRMAISLTSDFKDSCQENYVPIKQIDLCSKACGFIKNQTCSNGQYNAYLKFYTQYGVASNVLSQTIRLVNSPQILPSVPSIPKNLPSAIFQKNLYFGIYSADVRRLQILLATKPEIYPEGLITGYFGSLTKKAVQTFQLKYKVVKSKYETGFGVVGPKTRAKLKEVFGGTPAYIRAPMGASSQTTGNNFEGKNNSSSSIFLFQQIFCLH